MNWSELFTYEPDTGVIRWKTNRPGRGCVAGREAGTITNARRYCSVMVNGKRHYVHRVVWELVHGPVPDGMCIDHIDGNGLNNRLANLRITTLSGNQRNRRIGKNCRTGVIGVNNHPAGGFSVHCSSKYIGYSNDFETAKAMRKAAESEHGYHPNHGRKQHASS